ncbi:Subtilisin-like protease [Morella rubra]|uniref:Subtilisin-like protease n=1 Tax=Morella rubra TaxID=262757 RepID=A0A6A1V6H6_9ROSI|nr:Subtilisin-like protease [Morella rubra]
MGSVLKVNRLSFLFFLAWCLSILLAKSTALERSAYIVHMDKSLMPMAFRSHRNWYTSIVDSLRFVNPASLVEQQSSPSLLYVYNNALHGFSAFLCKDELKSLKKSRGFVSASKDKPVKLETTYTPQYLSLNPFHGLWLDSNYGEDVIIGIIDSGIWPEHPSFKDDGMSARVPAKWQGSCQEGEDFNSSNCNLKLIGAKYFNEAVSHALEGRKIRMNSARDITGHGTVVASVAAGNYVNGASYFGYAEGTAKGVAPRARLAVYKVCWEEGNYDADVVAGIDHAIADGVDVISISQSYFFAPKFNDPISVGSFSALEKGIVVSTAAGNYGPRFTTVANPMPWVLTVTASSTDRWLGGTLTLGMGLDVTGWSTYPYKTVLQNLPLVYKKPLSSCDSPALLSTAPYGIILCDLGPFLERQISSITSSNVSGAILIASTLFELPKTFCACLVISSKDARVVINYAESNIMASASIRFQQSFMDARPSPTVARYASRGPALAFSGILKPDVMAPGSDVLAAWIPTLPVTEEGSHVSLLSDYILVSGTSIACPHASGVALLLKSVHPEWSPSAIKSAIITTANPLDNTLEPIRDLATYLQASPLAMGAGQINPNQALDPGLIYDAAPQDYVNVLCSSTFNLTQKDIERVTSSKNYNCSHPSRDLNYPSFIAVYNDQTIPLIQTFQRTVTNVGKGAATYKAIVTAPEDSEVRVSPNRLVFGKKFERHSYNMTIKFKASYVQQVSYGALVWVDEGAGNHTVRSPIVVCPFVV